MIDPGDPGAPKDDPRSVRLNELRTKSKDGRRSKNGLTPEEVKEYRSLVHELVVEQVEQAKQGPPRFAVMTSDSNSFRAMPMRKRAKEAGVDENDPLLLWALEAQEKADWRANPAGWLEMNAAVWAFLEAHSRRPRPGETVGRQNRGGDCQSRSQHGRGGRDYSLLSIGGFQINLFFRQG
jgi:hypothetical protein